MSYQKACLSIPNIIHFVLVVEEPSVGHLTLPHYLAVKSAVVANQPDRVLFHCSGHEPSGEWWEKIKPLVEVRSVQAPQEIHGRPLLHPAHKADIIRLQALREFGGIYLDFDTITVRSLAPFRKHPFVIGRQAAVFPWNWKQRLKKSMLELTVRYLRRPPSPCVCNAVMLSEPDSFFVKIWLEAYRSFRSMGRDAYWGEHSCYVPLWLAREHPQKVYLASEWAFQYPLFDDMGLEDLFVHAKQFPRSYVHHLWESFSRAKYLDHLTIDSIRTQDTTYNRIARKYL